VTGQDKGGNFIGDLWVNRQNLGTALLEEGLASVSRGSRDSEAAREYETAEELAKKYRKNLWKDYDPVAEEAARRKRYEQQETESAKHKAEALSVIVTEIEHGTRFYLQVVGPDVQQLETLMKNLATQENTDANHHPKQGELVRAKFTADDNYYRAKVLSVKGSEYEVLYVDYGNSEVIPGDRITKLNPEFAQLRPQARVANLAFVRGIPLSDDLGEDAAEELRELVWGKTLSANVEWKAADESNNKNSEGELFVSLYDEDHTYINAEIIRAGLGRVDKVRGRQYTSQLDALKEAENDAKKAHVALWQYGDPGSDEDEEAPKFGAKPAAKGGKK